jgi:hypothetical protein
MNVELARLKDGRPLIVADSQLPHPVQRVEFYRDQRLVVLVYDKPDHEDDLMQCELTEASIKLFEDNSRVMVVSYAGKKDVKYYDVSLVKV